jgi:predicted regulator of Ras-like GTPase activity (Roadblock/LC7/MglB family)
VLKLYVFSRNLSGQLYDGTKVSSLSVDCSPRSDFVGGNTMAKGEALKATLESLRNAIPELKGVLLASNEGLPIAHALTNGADPNRIAAMATAASGLGRRISETMNAGTLGEISIQAEEGALFVYSAGNKAVLAVLSPQGSNAGLIHLEARSAAKEIGELF